MRQRQGALYLLQGGQQGGPHPFRLTPDPTLRLSGNHGPARKATLGVLIHSTRSGRFTREEEYEKTLSYMLQSNSNSSHRVIGVLPGQHALVVADDFIAWHAEELNAKWLGIELAQPTAGQPYSDWQYETAAAVVREWAEKYGFALDREHIVGHEETDQGKRWGKTDPGDKWDWEKFMALTDTL